MNRPPHADGAGRPLRHATARTGPGRPPLTALTIRFDDGHRVDIHCHPRPDGMVTIQMTTRPADTCEHAKSAEIIRLTRAGFLTTTGRRGAAAGTIFMRGGDFDRAVDVVNALDLLGGAALAAVGITDPDEARTILAALWCI
jgi:hypothetical protein